MATSKFLPSLVHFVRGAVYDVLDGSVRFVD